MFEWCTLWSEVLPVKALGKDEFQDGSVLFLHLPDEGTVTAELGRTPVEEINSADVCDVFCESGVEYGTMR
jgi:hypothetical protein